MQDVRPLTVLTVDDSEIVHKMLSIVISENENLIWLGHAFSLEDAHKQLSTKKPQVVILDIHLKANTSFGLLEHISKHHPDTAVIMLSNISTAPYRKKCRELGAMYYIDKSTELEKLSVILAGLSASA